MELFNDLVEWTLHLDDKLKQLVEVCGGWSYAILFVIIFCETGLVITPFLPGDSLLFTCGMLAGDGWLNLGAVMAVLLLAAVLGDTVNYQIGHYIGPKVFREGRQSRWLKQEHLDRTHRFFEKYGGKTIIIARFVPIVRTFAPFVAGVGAMTYSKFLLYNVIGGLLWVVSLVLSGYLFGSLPWVRKNLSIVIILIIVVSMLPAMIEYWRARRGAIAAPTTEADEQSEKG
ncbi:MAG: DedA family protein [Phycisphaerales bacterium]|nr:DedA family protein [Phycisphaerales bacterium]MCI0630371.1 DedA family protein [Phycisphaerales bacterium]MCI0676643.1 DedA family protein [Phycisphaerales bacterium]